MLFKLFFSVLVFGLRKNVRVKKVNERLYAALHEALQNGKRTRGAAGVQKDFSFAERGFDNEFFVLVHIREFIAEDAIYEVVHAAWRL